MRCTKTPSTRLQHQSPTNKTTASAVQTQKMGTLELTLIAVAYMAPFVIVAALKMWQHRNNYERFNQWAIYGAAIILAGAISMLVLQHLLISQ